MFTTLDRQNIISWFERIYNSDEELSDYEREVDLNNDKRKIELVNKVLVSTIRDELKTLFGD